MAFRAIEEPAVYSLLPSLSGLRILDIGCGFRKFVSFCLKNGAEFVLGADISQNIISEAKKNIKDPRASFSVIPAENFDAEETSGLIITSATLKRYCFQPKFKLYDYSQLEMISIQYLDKWPIL